MTPISKPPFTVLIVGGGVAGLTLALSLQYANIDYLLLEARSDITPQVGASIGILPHGARILDQLGVWEDLLLKTAEFTTDTTWIDNGKKLRQVSIAELVEARNGYKGCFIQRKELLKSFYEKIDEKKRVLTGQKVVKIEHNEKGVVVYCENGKVYRGDVVVGADGVHSGVREEMRKYADEVEGTALMEKDRKSLYAEYSLLYGIADAVAGIEEGGIIRSYFKGFSFLTIGGINATYFFGFKKLDKRTHAPHIPRFSGADAEKCAAEFAECFITDEMKFSDIWQRRKISGMAATEESQNEHWTWGRFVCIGDSIHKVTPNAGQGGNAAMESAAALANVLYSLLHTKKDEKISLQDIKTALKTFQDSRKVRSELISKEANDFTRIEALNTWKEEFIVRYFIPNSGDFMVDQFLNSACGGIGLEFLPEPERAKGNLLGFNRKWGIGNEESIWWRLMRALPLLVIGVLAWWCIRENAVVRMLERVGEVTEQGGFVDGERVVTVREIYTGIKWFDQFMQNYVYCFTPSIIGLDDSIKISRSLNQEINNYAPNRLQMLTFLTDLTPLISIILVEAQRRGNILTPIRIPLPFLLLTQHLGIGVVAPFYFLLHTVLLPPSKYRSLDNRLTQINYAKTILPALIIGYVIPTAGSYWPTSSIYTLQGWNFIWQLFPIWVLGLHSCFARFVKDTTFADKSRRPKADLPYLRAVYLLSFLLSASIFVYVRTVSPIPILQLFFKDLSNPRMQITSFVQGIDFLLRYDEVFAFTAAYWWIVLVFWDLKKEEKVSVSWGTLIACMGVGSVVAGPGATLAAMAWWREEALAWRYE